MTKPISGTINGLRWNGSYWLAFGASPKIAKSYDGIMWTSTTTDFSIVNDIKFQGTLWVAVGYIGNYGNGLICYSDDGLTWTKATTDISTFSPTITAWPLLTVEWNGTTWLAAGFYDSAFPIILVSTDGINWQAQKLSGGLQGIYLVYKTTVLWDGSSWVINFPFSQNNSIYYEVPIIKNTNSPQLSSLVYKNGIYLGTTVQGLTSVFPPQLTGNQRLYFSTDLTTFTDITAKTELLSVAGLAYNGTYWLVFGTNGVAINVSPSTTSSWTKTALSFSPTEVKWLNTYWVATNAMNTATSTDGVTWSTQSIINLNNLAYNGQYWLSYTTDTLEKVTPWQKIVPLHSPPGNILPPIYLKLVGNPITSRTELTLESQTTGTRFLLQNIKNITTGAQILQAKTPTSTTIFTISKNNKVFFGLIELQGKKNGKWYTISYIKKKTYII